MVRSFDDLSLTPAMREAIARVGYTTPTPIQAQAIGPILEGRDLIGCAQTGTGKTAAFAIPTIERLTGEGLTPPTRGGLRPPRALVLAPTRELALQIAEAFDVLGRAQGVTVAVLIGGESMGPQLAALQRRPDVIVATPGRLFDHVERRTLALGTLRIVVLDEADRMLDMGFQPQVDKIVRRLPRNRQTMFFSATLDDRVGELARAYTNSPSRIEGELSLSRQPGEIEHHFVSVTSDTKLETLVEHIRASDSTLVFVRTKRGAERLVTKLARHGVKASAMHGDMSQNARQRALRQFESGKVAVLVATDVAARGLDLDDITHVINFDPPAEDKGYVHRTGRTGRAGRSGTAITLVLPEQQADTSRVARRLGHTEQYEQSGLESARAKVVYTSRRGRRSKW